MSNKRYLSMSLNPTATGGNKGAWKLTGRDAVFKFDSRIRIAEMARDGGFDALWLPDLPHHIPGRGSLIAHPYEPLLLMTAIAGAVPDIGLVPTISSTYSHPYNIARSVLTLDNISRGRAGVNIVASYSPTVARNFGADAVPSYEDRYGQAHEYFDVLKKLFDSNRLDPAYTDAPGDIPDLYNEDLVNPIDYDGRYFQIAGPNTTPLWNNERPLIATAGGSEHSIDLAARHADAFYVVALSRQASANFNREVRTRVIANGRRAEDLVVVPGLTIILGSTEEEARRQLQSRITLSGDTAQNGVEYVSRLLGIEPDKLHPDRQLTEEQLSHPAPGFTRPIGFFRALTDLAREDNLTAEALGQRICLGFGHRLLVGTPESVADDLQSWFDSGAADGFTVHLNSAPEELPPIVEHLMPLLRKRGLTRPGYGPEPLRQRFGLE